MLKLIRKFCRKYITNPEVLIGFPQSGKFWSSIGPHDHTAEFSKETELLAKYMMQIGIKSLDRDLEEMRARTKNSRDEKLLRLALGEHYRFLEELSFQLKPKLVIEIGTHKGMGTLALGRYAEKLITFDIKPWNQFQETLLVKEDFGRFVQEISDLSRTEEWTKYEQFIATADIVFLDGPKDNHFEAKVLPLLTQKMKRGSLLVIDDIRFLNMIGLWQNITMPKFDATSFAHFSGTGVVHIASKSFPD